METSWILTTHGDPIGSLQQFIQTLWRQSGLDGMLVSLSHFPGGIRGDRAATQLLDDPAQLENFNPFNPLMTVNAARRVPEILRERPGAKLGVILRPCEMRALIEMVKHDSFSLDHVLTICVDCLGTFPAEDIEWRTGRKGSADRLASESLQFARQGAVAAYRFRSACQTCVSPEARGAQVNIGALGLPVRQVLLVSVPDEAVAQQLNIPAITSGAAEAQLTEQRAKILANQAERQSRHREQIISGLGDALPHNLETLLQQFESCGACQKCLEACPICSVAYPQKDSHGKYPREAVASWLVSCAGCGMCESSCPGHLPLAAIFANIRQQVDERYGYKPGESLSEPLPAIVA